MQQLPPAKRNLAILTPLFAVLSAWLCAAVAKYGIHLDPSGVNAALVAGATAGTAVGVKLIHDVKLPASVQADIKVAEQAAAAADPSLAAELSGAWDPAPAPTAPQAPAAHL